MKALDRNVRIRKKEQNYQNLKKKKKKSSPHVILKILKSSRKHGLFQRGKQGSVVWNNLSVMTLINPVAKHLVIRKKISICGRKWVLVNLYGWRG